LALLASFFTPFRSPYFRTALALSSNLREHLSICWVFDQLTFEDPFLFFPSVRPPQIVDHLLVAECRFSFFSVAALCPSSASFLSMSISFDYFFRRSCYTRCFLFRCDLFRLRSNNTPGSRNFFFSSSAFGISENRRFWFPFFPSRAPPIVP